MRRFSLIGAAGYIGSRQIQAIRDIGNGLDIAADRTSAWVQYTIRVRDRLKVQEALKAEATPAAIYYPLPLSFQASLADPAVTLSNGDVAAREALSLPMHPYLSDATLRNICSAVNRAVRG